MYLIIYIHTPTCPSHESRFGKAKWEISASAMNSLPIEAAEVRRRRGSTGRLAA